jgi:hypothetical protein
MLAIPIGYHSKIGATKGTLIVRELEYRGSAVAHFRQLDNGIKRIPELRYLLGLGAA